MPESTITMDELLETAGVPDGADVTLLGFVDDGLKVEWYEQ